MLRGGGDEPVEVVLPEEPLPLPLPEDEPLEEPDGGGGGGGGGEEHDSETLAIPAFTGSEIDDSGVPGGTFTVNVNLCPVTVVTVTTHVSAEAIGIEASPITTSTALVVTNPTSPLWFLIAVVILPPAYSRK